MEARAGLGLTCLGQKAGGGLRGPWLCASLRRPVGTSSKSSIVSAPQSARLHRLQGLLHNPTPPAPPQPRGAWHKARAEGPSGAVGTLGRGVGKERRGSNPNFHLVLKSGWGLGTPLQSPGYTTLPPLPRGAGLSVQPALELQPVLVLGLGLDHSLWTQWSLVLVLPARDPWTSLWLCGDKREAGQPPTWSQRWAPNHGPGTLRRARLLFADVVLPSWTSAPSWPGVHPDRPQAPCRHSYRWS